MTMTFDVVDPSLIEGLQVGEPVNIVIERYADGRHHITDIEGAAPTAEPVDHATHDMEMPR